MIIARNIQKSFAQHRILKGINLRINRGSIFGLAGRSGAGKSTFLRCINGIEPYDSGELKVSGVEIGHLRNKQLRAFRKTIGMVFQNFSLLERLNVFENVALPMKCWKYDKLTIDSQVKKLVGLVGLSELITRKPRELSGGQKQRVAIARALSLTPEVLLCDEATSALDPKTAQEILLLLQEINDRLGITIIMVTHQMTVLTSICKEMAIMEHGRVECQGMVDKIFREQPQELRNLLGANHFQTSSTSQTTTISLLEKKPDIVTQLVSEFKIDITVTGRQPNGSGLTLQFPTDMCEKVTEYLDTHNLSWKILFQYTDEAAALPN
ncbi:MAG: ATP-binding cassette domain-containing protein [Pseudomonadota bacterium]